MTWYVGVDLGATNVKTAVGDGSGSVCGRDRRQTPSESDGEAIATAVVESIHESMIDAGAEAPIERVGIGSIGPLDREAGVVVDPVNLPNVERIPIQERVETALGAPVVLHNDATVGAIGECYFGEETPRNLVYLTLSTGVGAGVVCDGRVLDGSNGNAGEVGHVTLDPDADVVCGCGAPGHWEAFCGGANLPAYADYLGKTTDVDGSERFDSPAAIFAAGDSDPLAALVIERIGKWNAVGVATVVQAFDPETVVFGGAVALNNPTAILDPVERSLPEMLLGDPPTLRLTDRGDTAVVDGALASAYTNGGGPASLD